MRPNIPFSPSKSKPRGESAWYPRRPRAFFNGCLGMTFEERAAYSTLLDLIYEHGGPIYYDLGHIASHMGTGFPTRKAAALIRRLEELGKIYRTRDGLIGNEGADQALEEAAEKRAKAIADGAKGGRPAGAKSELSQEQVEKKSDTSPEEVALSEPTSSELSEAKASEISNLAKGFPFLDENPNRKEEKRKDSKGEIFERLIEENFPPFWDAYPARPNDSRKKALEKYRAAIKAGATPEEIFEGVKRYARDRTGQDPQYTQMAATWLYQEKWKPQRPSNGSGASAAGGPDPAAPAIDVSKFTDNQWKTILRHGMSGTWLLDYGPPPWREGCLVPEHLLEPMHRRRPGGVVERYRDSNFG